MSTRLLRFPSPALSTLLGAAAILTLGGSLAAAEPLTVSADFEGGSVGQVEIDSTSRTIRFMPGGDPVHGWPCWWYFRISGITPGETITLQLKASTAMVAKPGSPLAKPLAASWAMAKRATWSSDGRSWRHTEPGKRQDEWMTYVLQPEAATCLVAWGPPFTPSSAAELVRRLSQQSPHAQATELCRSRGDRPVPMLHVQEGPRGKEQRFGVWVQARQHAWESGSSWVAQGFAEWLVSDDAEAAWLRQHAEVYLVPIMDIDNTAAGNGGKDAEPHDHNRDWSAEPHWKETAAAQGLVGGLIKQGRMDVFLDLHNPAPEDPTFFYVLDRALLAEPAVVRRDRFIELAYGRISRLKPLIPMSNKPKATGPAYHPRWREISANWVAMHGNPHTVSLCLETIWNGPSSTTDGYRAVGAALAASVRAYLGEQELRK